MKRVLGKYTKKQISFDSRDEALKWIEKQEKNHSSEFDVDDSESYGLGRFSSFDDDEVNDGTYIVCAMYSKGDWFDVYALRRKNKEEKQ